MNTLGRFTLLVFVVCALFLATREFEIWAGWGLAVSGASFVTWGGEQETTLHENSPSD